MENLRETTLPEVATIERAKKGKIYPGGETLIELSATKGAVSYHSTSGEISTRYAVVTPDDRFLHEYFFIVVERGLPEFIHKYLTTMNLQVDALKHYKIQYHDNFVDQSTVVGIYHRTEKEIAAEERIIRALSDLKKFYLRNMFPEM